MNSDELLVQGQQMMRICNSCRYCEGLCAVWRSMEYRREFSEGDLNYLANLCHDCTECYYACQYAPPHDWAINPPLTFARIRTDSYEKYAWPKGLASAFRANGLVVSLVTVLGLITFILGIAQIQGRANMFRTIAGGDFYQVVSHDAMVVLFGLVGLLSVGALSVGVARFVADMDEKFSSLMQPRVMLDTIKETINLKYLDGGGWGCSYPDDERSPVRRWLHHFTFYGFLLCVAATTVGFIYDFVFNWPAPYEFLSLPVILGTLGGIGLLIGPVGLLSFKFRRNRDISDDNHSGMDSSFLVLLALASGSGLLLLFFRETSALAILLAIHLGIVMGFFLTAPYSKFVHGIYRFLAIGKYVLERRREKTIGG